MKTQIFEPLLKEFCMDTQSINLSPYNTTIFLPHVMSDYNKAKQKIFYFGRDTYGWLKTEVLMNRFTDSELDLYADDTTSWINKYGFLEFNKNSSSGFWTLAMKLHLRLKGISGEVKISSNILEEHKLLLNDFGYGNLNSFEVPETLVKQGVWDCIDQAKYWEIKNKSRIFDKLKYTIESYNPELIFVFNWKADESLFLEGLEYTVEKLGHINNQFYIYYFPKTKTRLIWTVHPNNLRYQGCNVDNLINIILGELDKRN